VTSDASPEHEVGMEKNARYLTFVLEIMSFLK
jgi:hypothetical protein